MHHLLFIIYQYSYAGIFAALALGILGLPIPDETLMAFIGFMSFQGKLNIFSVLVTAFIGTSCGITISYLFGKWFGNRFLEKYALKMNINKDRLQDARAFWSRYGKFALTIGYFIPGIRHFTAVFAGISKMPYPVFAAFAYAGGMLWTITFVSLGYALGENWHLVTTYSNRYLIPVILLTALIFFFFVYLRRK